MRVAPCRHCGRLPHFARICRHGMRRPRVKLWQLMIAVALIAALAFGERMRRQWTYCRERAAFWTIAERAERGSVVTHERLLAPSPKFPGNPRDHSPCSQTPARPNPRNGTTCQRIRHGPRLHEHRRLSTTANFGAQSHGIWSHYASRWKSPATTQDSLPAAGPRPTGRDSHPQGSSERFLNM